MLLLQTQDVIRLLNGFEMSDAIVYSRSAIPPGPDLVSQFWQQQGTGTCNVLRELKQILAVLQAMVDKNQDGLPELSSELESLAEDTGLAAVLKSDDLGELADFIELMEHLARVVIEDVAYMAHESLKGSTLLSTPFFASEAFQAYAGKLPPCPSLLSTRIPLL